MPDHLKRLLNPADDVVENTHHLDIGARPDYGSQLPQLPPLPQFPLLPHLQDSFHDQNGFLDVPRESQYIGPSVMNPNRYRLARRVPRTTNTKSFSDIPVFDSQDSLSDIFSNIMVDRYAGPQMSTMNFSEENYNLDAALAEWGDQLHPTTPLTFSCQDASPTATLEPEPHRIIEDPTCSAEVEETICYGMLHNVDVKLVGEMSDIASRVKRTGTAHENLMLCKKEDRINLCFRDDGYGFGYLRTNAETPLKPLLEKSGVELEPMVLTFSLKEIMGRASKTASAMIKADINIYGPRSLAVEVGKVLSGGKQWLQKPDHVRSNVIYDNPHLLPVSSNGFDVQSVRSATQNVQNAQDGTATRKRREDQLRSMVQAVYKSVDNSRDLEMVDGGDRVARKLLKHQQEALAFMLERESGHINYKYRLWQHVVPADGKEFYRHKITQAKRHNLPEERGGGILADEMGMGKSLSVLALIMKTVNAGKDWAEEQGKSLNGRVMLEYSRSTLVVVSSALLITNWMREIEKHLSGGVNVIKYHGPDRPKDPNKVQDSDIVVTTYNTLAAEFQNKAEPSPLHRIGWYRVVLDEGKLFHKSHIIRRPTTSFYHACEILHANSRWCLTGTPIQNKLADIGTLFAFIRAEPFSKASIFRRWIEQPFEQSIDKRITDGRNGITKGMYEISVAQNRLVMLLEALCLRRTKDIIDLPELEERNRKLELSPAEREQYEKTKNTLVRAIRQRADGVEKCSKFGLFQANLQMRILCNHGTFQKPFSWNRRAYQDEREAVISAIGPNGEIICSGCHQPMPILGSSRLGNGFVEDCAHALCDQCIEESAMPDADSQTKHCPVCLRWGHQIEGSRRREGEAGTSERLSNNAMESDHDYYFNAEGYSTKMRALVEDVGKDLDTTKSIIFSCWTRTLHLVSKHLDAAKIPYLRIDGGCSLAQRQIKLDRFSNESEFPVLIMTTGTGAFGLNLTCANRVFIVELQWNPAVENQAIARAIRIGQDSVVCVTRYVVLNTVEEEMMSQQKWKKGLSNLGFPEQLESVDAEQGMS
ncbi:hypothetical protein QQS21_003141 [Conoideocrella luteorostrata]|uniref:Uncharacterized protein n=1 Tax=Conoideocrella luteorostrata TaxID=1105319 RepID=A0AAJ0CWW0_9HYPO|nr:hypothetical protein QQS21_003141 [Conoideocrella luteorostrata]